MNLLMNFLTVRCMCIGTRIVKYTWETVKHLNTWICAYILEQSFTSAFRESHSESQLKNFKEYHIDSGDLFYVIDSKMYGYQ